MRLSKVEAGFLAHPRLCSNAVWVRQPVCDQRGTFFPPRWIMSKPAITWEIPHLETVEALPRSQIPLLVSFADWAGTPGLLILFFFWGYCIEVLSQDSPNPIVWVSYFKPHPPQGKPFSPSQLLLIFLGDNVDFCPIIPLLKWLFVTE